MATKKLFNAKTQKVENADFTVDANNEIVATFKDGSFVKFAPGLTKKEFDVAVVAQQTSNEGQEIITPKVLAAQEKERAASLALIGEDDANPDQE